MAAGWNTAIKGRAGWLVLLFAAVALLVIGGLRAAGPATPDERITDLEQRLACPECAGESVYESNALAAINIRREIERFVDEGRLTDDEIVARLTESFGDLSLLPRSEGVEALAWALPVAAAVAGGVGLVVAFQRWRREGAVDVDPTEEDRELVASAVGSGALTAEATTSATPSSPVAGRSAVDLDQLAQLEAERSFLLRSLRDLEAEYLAGDVDDADYEALRDGYTKRAADVLRAIDAGKVALPARATPNWGKRLAIGAVIVVATAGIGWLVAAQSGQRGLGDSMTGGEVADRDDVPALLTEARLLFSNGLFPDATERYTRVLTLQSDNAEARTYLAWLLVQDSLNNGTEQQRVEAFATAEDQLRQAIDIDDTYADPWCFLSSIVDDDDEAAELAQGCLDRNPPQLLVPLAESVLERTQPASSSPVADSAPDSTPGTEPA